MAKGFIRIERLWDWINSLYPYDINHILTLHKYLTSAYILEQNDNTYFPKRASMSSSSACETRSFSTLTFNSASLTSDSTVAPSAWLFWVETAGVFSYITLVEINRENIGSRIINRNLSPSAFSALNQGLQDH
jgi:hypothetical protein